MSKSVEAAVTAGVPPVGSFCMSVRQNPVQPIAELEEDEDPKEADDEALEDGKMLVLALVVRKQ